MINTDKLLTFVEPYYKNKDIMHNLSHIERVLKHVNKLLESGKYIVKSLIVGSVRGQTLEQTINYIEDNVLNKGICYLPEAENVYIQQQEFAKSFICDLKEGLE